MELVGNKNELKKAPRHVKNYVTWQVHPLNQRKQRERAIGVRAVASVLCSSCYKGKKTSEKYTFSKGSI